MVYNLPTMPSYPHIQRYRDELSRLVEFGGSDNELNIRPAFQNCLTAYCRDHRERLAMVPELRAANNVIPDGTVKDTLRMARGYWEAEDSHDDLNAEIERKFNRGYPRDNIIFEDSQTAVLIQNREEAMRADMSRPGELHRLIRRFLDYELPQIEEFRQAQSQFKNDLPAVLANLRETIEDAENHNADYRAAANDFLELCKETISPNVSAEDVREMLLQHILTRDIFLRVFAEDQFHTENNVARRLDTLEQTFFTGDLRRQAIDRLRAYYGAIGRAADEIADYAEKQQFLKAIYEDFYKAYNPSRGRPSRRRLHPKRGRGLHHTRRGRPAEEALRTRPRRRQRTDSRSRHRNRNVRHQPHQLPTRRQTGIQVPQRNSRQRSRHTPILHSQPEHRIHLQGENGPLSANSPTSASLTPSTTWTGSRAGATGGAVTRQAAFNLGGLSTENWMRVQLQNEKPISVIIGNPPYNANQQPLSENDGGNKNREYPDIDRRITRYVYHPEGTAQKTHQYDMYKRFIRWASDRLDDDGIITRLSPIAPTWTARQDDGFRKVAAREFTDIYVLDLGSDVRRNPKISGTTHNVFGIQTGVAIGFFVRDKSRLGKCGIHYARREDS